MVTLHPIEDHSGCISRSHTLMVVSVLPLTSLFPSRWRQRTSPEWPDRVMTDQGLLVLMFHTRMVLSCEPDTMRLLSNCTQLMPPEWPCKKV